MGNAPATVFSGSCLDAYKTPPPPPPPTEPPPDRDLRWVNLASDVLRQIFLLLAPVDVVRAGLACKRWQSLALSPEISRRLKGGLKFALWQPRIRLVDVEAAFLQPDAPAAKEHTEPFREVFGVANEFFNLTEPARQKNASYETSESRVPLNQHSGVLTTQFCSSLRMHWNAPDSPFVGATPEQQEVILRYYRAMGQLSTYLIHMIGHHCCPERNVAQFASYADILPASGVSQTHLRFVCTHAVGHGRPLKEHQDGGLLTLLPLAQHSGGLELFIERQWMPVETIQRRTDILVLAGITLEHLTAPPHRVVSNQSAARIGAPFLMRAVADRVLDCNLLDEKVCKEKAAYVLWERTAAQLINERKMSFDQKFSTFSPPPPSVGGLTYVGFNWDFLERLKFWQRTDPVTPLSEPLYESSGSARNPLSDH